MSECFLLDIECQRDFFTRGGKCHKGVASLAAKRVYELFAWARSFRIPVISTVLRSRRDVGAGNGRYCVEGSDGERKLARTVLSRRVNLGLRNTTDLPEDLLASYRQVIFEKRNTDIFTHARAERLITRLNSGTFVICGAGIEHGIVQAAVGLRNRGFEVIVASDAVVAVDPEAGEMACRRMEAKGTIFLPTRQIVAEHTGVVSCARRGTSRKVPVPAA